jgi:hypothetical protein
LDGQLEVVRHDRAGKRRPTGRVVSVQVRTGASYHADDRGDHWIVPIKKSTVAYWRSHSVPVILVLVDPTTRICHWVRGDTDHRERTNDYAVRVPKANVLDANAKDALEELAANVSPAGRRLAVLEGAVPWMEMLGRGERLYVNVDEWINKSSGRMDVSIGTYVEKEKEIGSHKYRTTDYAPQLEFMTMGVTSWREMVRRQLPWAKLILDESQEPDEDELHDRYLGEYGTWDSEDDRYYDCRGEFDSYRKAAMKSWREGFIGEYAGEVFTYRMELKLNRVGRAFLHVHRYLHRGPQPAKEL